MNAHARLNSSQKEVLRNIIANNKSPGLEVKRAQAILLLDDGEPIAKIIRFTNYRRRHIFHLRQRFIKEGGAALTDRRKGKPKELLTKKQRKEIIETLKTKTPNECDPYYNSDYWSTGILAEYILKAYTVQYKSKTSYHIVFRQAKFSYHKPGTVYQRRNQEEVDAWKEKIKPLIQKAWSDDNVVILAQDEMHLSTQTTIQKIWLPKGEYPKIEISKKRESRSIYGFLNVKTGREHAFKTKWQNMYINAEVLPQVRKMYPTQTLLLLWDKAPWHQGRVAQEYIAKDGNIQTISFPGAAPDQNPQEHVWKKGRSHVTHNNFLTNIDQATDDFVNYLNTTKFRYSLVGFSAIS